MFKETLTGKTIRNLSKGFLNKSLSSYLILFVNNICQLRCDMCFYWDSMQIKTKQLSLEEIIKLSKSLPNLLQLTLTGGEPFLRKDLHEMPKIFSKYSNLSKCTVVTNGMLYERIRNQVFTFVNENKNVDDMRVLLIEETYSMEEVVAVLRDEYEGKGFDIPKRLVGD